MSTPEPNIKPVDTSKHKLYIIITGFGIVGALGAMAVWLPDNAVKVEFALGAAIGGILAFLAGSKKA